MSLKLTLNILKPADTSPTTKTTTTTTTPRLPVTCNKTSLIEAVAVNRPVTHPLVSPCSDPYYSPPEALTIKYCALPLASGWTKGQKVRYREMTSTVFLSSI